MYIILALLLCGVCSAAPPATIVEDSQRLTVSNGFVQVSFNKLSPQLDVIGADFSGQGIYENTVGTFGDPYGRRGFVLERQDPDDTLHVSSVGMAPKLTTSILENSGTTATVQISNIYDDNNEAQAFASENWIISLRSGDRYFTLTVNGVTLRHATIKSLRHTFYFSAPSIYALYDRGVVQMMNLPNCEFGSVNSLPRLYTLGDGTSVEIQRAIDSSKPDNTLLLVNGTFYQSGLEEVIIGIYPLLDQWLQGGWHDAQLLAVDAGYTWTYTSKISPNNYDFPVLTPLTSAPLGPTNLVPMDTDDLHAILTGIYASPVGCLETYNNATTPGQIATTIHTPFTGYSNLYNFFDPDGYFSVGGLILSGDPYLMNQAKLVLSRSASFMLFSGQLPHHFEGSEPIYVAISGATQTGPNIFWTLTLLRYVKFSGDLDFLREMMPQLEASTEFLLSFYDPTANLINAPGPLWIDVFIRNNFTSDTNAIMPHLLEEMALAEDYLGNPSQAAKYRAIENAIIVAYRNTLWNTTANDHYVTQVNVDGTTRDFVDYDSNLLAIAFNVATDEQCSRILGRIDSGSCVWPSGKPTWVSEYYYNTSDCYEGNTGDSATAMARIGWADAFARRRVNDYSHFSGMLRSVQNDLLANTWLTERYNCSGGAIRTPYYYEYPTFVALLLRELKYGMDIELQSFELNPWEETGVGHFGYHIGNVNVDYFPPNSVTINLPGPPSPKDNLKNVIVHGLAPNQYYNVQVTGPSENCYPGTLKQSTDINGVISFYTSVHSNCVISISISSAAS